MELLHSGSRCAKAAPRGGTDLWSLWEAVVRWGALLLALLLTDVLGCRCGSERVAPSAALDGGAAPGTARAVSSSRPIMTPIDRPSGWVLVASSTPGSAEVKYLPIHVAPWLEGEALAFGDGFVAPTLSTTSLENSPGSGGRLLAAYDHPHFVLASPGGERSDDAARLKVRDLAEGVIREIPAGRGTPTAVHIHRRQLLVAFTERGVRNEVVVHSLAAPGGHRRVLHDQRYTEGDKPYDFFMSDGHWVVAVDDYQRPFHALELRVTQRRAEFRKTWTLPELVNGHYVHGLVIRHDASADATLLLVAAYSISTHRGQILVSLPVRGEELDRGDAELLTQLPQLPGRAWLEERDANIGEEDVTLRKLLGGARYTAWTGLALVPGGDDVVRVALAAGSRGLLIVSPGGAHASSARVLDLGGACLDVLRVGDALVVLVASAPERTSRRVPRGEGSPTKIVALRWHGGAHQIVGEAVLASRFDSFIR